MGKICFTEYKCLLMVSKLATEKNTLDKGKLQPKNLVCGYF